MPYQEEEPGISSELVIGKLTVAPSPEPVPSVDAPSEIDGAAMGEESQPLDHSDLDQYEVSGLYFPQRKSVIINVWL